MSLPSGIGPNRAAELLAAVTAAVPAMRRNATACDAQAAFPAADIDTLRAAGLFAAPIAPALGGLGAGTEPQGAALARQLLVLCGSGSGAIARIFEAHLNALLLIQRYGTPAQQRQAAADALAGHLFGLWVTDPPGAKPLSRVGGVLAGRKGPCSGAGHCTRALLTVTTEHGTSLALIALRGNEPITPIAGLHGMRAAANGVITLDGVAAPESCLVGQPGDYLREPLFSCGAWRGSAASLGILESLAAEFRAHVTARGHHHAPSQQTRFGRIMIALETARLFTAQAEAVAEGEGFAPDFQVATVNLARLAVEAACLDALRDIQRGLGLAAFVAPHPVERLARDLTTYLRQPAPDEILLEAGRYFLAAA